MTAFAVLAAAVWLIRSAHESLDGWNRLKRTSVLLSIFLAVQIMLGVEAWMAKFAPGVVSELREVSPRSAIVPTAHVLVGTGILAISTCFVLLTRRPLKITEPAVGLAGQGDSPAPGAGIKVEAFQKIERAIQ